jgi:hypothetical protein
MSGVVPIFETNKESKFSEKYKNTSEVKYVGKYSRAEKRNAYT